MELYNKIGTGYNKTRYADPFIAERIIDLLKPIDAGVYLDIGCGTGNYTTVLSNEGLNMYGIDPSTKMLNEARSRNNEVKWIEGTAEKIPVADNFFDGVIATLTIHHWKNLDQAFKELFRVMKDDGQIVFFTSIPEQMKGYWLNHYFPEMLAKSIIQMPSFDTIKNNLTRTGFEIRVTEKYSIQDQLKDFFLYVGKNNPELYFDVEIRKGISSFAALANGEEVESGLDRLRSDMANGNFSEIKRQYDNDLGDYLFISAQKKNVD